MSDESSYRRLLWAYPGAYRRRHGTEIVTTMLEMAEAGYGRPGLRERLHLVACGLRQRFRIPVRRPLAIVAAVLAAVVLGAFGATFGTWAGWQTAESVPSDAAVRALSAEMSAYDSRSVEISPWATAMSGPVKSVGVRRGPPYSAERIRAALVADGWQITKFDESISNTVVDLRTDPWTLAPGLEVSWRATRGGLAMSGGAYRPTVDVALDTWQGYDVWALENGTVRPLTIAGLVAGLLAGWLLVAGFARRERGSRARGFASAALTTVAFAAAAVPVFDLGRLFYRVMTYDLTNPNPYIVESPDDMVPGWAILTCTAIGVLAVVLSALITRKSSPGPMSRSVSA